jgi:hypothetical protein
MTARREALYILLLGVEKPSGLYLKQTDKSGIHIYVIHYPELIREPVTSTETTTLSLPGLRILAYIGICKHRPGAQRQPRIV